jgi:N utilization substance protein A
MAVVSEFMAAVNQICAERGIDPEEVFIALESAVLAAYRKDYGGGESLRAEIDRETGEVHIIADKEVVEEITDEETQISLEEAQDLEPDLEVGDHLEIEMEVEGFGRIAAQTAKQVILQKVRESEKQSIIAEFEDRIGAVVTGMVQRMAGPTAVVEIGKAVAKMPPDEQIPNEFYKIGERYKFLLKEIRNDQDLIVSRGGSEFLVELFRLEVPEIESGVVEIKGCAREAGSRSKLAVVSNQDGIDPIGSCVGQKGVRIANIMSELGEEKIDIIEWAESTEGFVANALGPAQVESVEIEDSVAKVHVSDDQLSLAIGKDGQNVRLAAKLTGLKIDITSPSLDSKVSTQAQKGDADQTKQAEVEISDDQVEQIEEISDEVLGSRTKTALEKAGITPADLINMSEEEVLDIKGVGEASLEEVNELKNKFSDLNEDDSEDVKDEADESSGEESDNEESDSEESSEEDSTGEDE